MQELLKAVEAELLRRLSGPSTAAFSRQHLSNTVHCLPHTERIDTRGILRVLGFQILNWRLWLSVYSALSKST